ncbi:MAG TPA: hypothetical protein VK928_03880 [Longimicrobiales bacterium]|nr:hypothetical protein [Longimicrobiales bacterium]
MQPYSDTTIATERRRADQVGRVLRVAGLVIFALWVARYMREPEPLLHGSLLIFHEAGHVLFMPFGEFVMVLGGSLFQLMVPAFFVGYFMRRRDWYAAAIAALYLAASFDGVARYIADARAGDLELLGGERSNHDWTFLLIEMGMLERDLVIGRLVRAVGFLVYGAAALVGLNAALSRRDPRLDLPE